MNRRLDAKESEELFRELLVDFEIYAPTVRAGTLGFSGTETTVYDRINSLTEVDFTGHAHFSPKGILFPPRETLFTCTSRDINEPKGAGRPAIAILRSCDIHALKRLDWMFLKNGGYTDRYYERKRKTLKVFLLECAESFTECFCTAMGTNRTMDFDALIRPDQGTLLMSVKNSALTKYVARKGTVEKHVEIVFPLKDPEAVTVPDTVDDSVFGSTVWDEYSGRCSACGRCTVSCPTCTCFTVQTIPESGGEKGSERKRVWSSCQVKEFGLMAGNHDVRQKNGEKMRYKVLHKIVDFKKRAGFTMCVGCGRCEGVCPEYISMKKTIEKISSRTDHQQAGIDG